MTPARKSDRAKMAAELVALVERAGFTATVTAEWPAAGERETMVEIVADQARVGITFGALEATNGYVVPWNVAFIPDESAAFGMSRAARFSDAFGAACAASVNPHHRAKCMGHYRSWELALAYINRALRCVREGKAFDA